MGLRLLGILACAAIGAVAVHAADGPRVLFLNKSAGFEHSVIKVTDGAPSHVEKIIQPLITEMGGVLATTKDGTLISAETLKDVDVVVFYTTEDLCKSDTGDMTPAVGPNGMMELLDWVKAGGGLVGYHCASDTWHRERNQYSPESPYLDMLGGEFVGHGQQFSGVLRVVDPKHPTVAHIKDGWTVNDEWYLFGGFQTDTMHVIALLDPAAERAVQEKYNIPNYPVIWCSAPGEGRVFYNAMGHREDVWEDETFQHAFVDAIRWANGEGEAGATPNYKDVVPSEISAEPSAAAADDPNLPRESKRKRREKE